MMYRWLVLLHVLGVFGFLMAHGISVSVAFTLRRERKFENIQALLNLYRATRWGSCMARSLSFF